MLVVLTTTGSISPGRMTILLPRLSGVRLNEIDEVLDTGTMRLLLLLVTGGGVVGLIRSGLHGCVWRGMKTS